MGLLSKIKGWISGKPRRKYSETYVVDLTDPDIWETAGNKFKCSHCGSLTITDSDHATCTRCNVSMEKR